MGFFWKITEHMKPKRKMITFKGIALDHQVGFNAQRVSIKNELL